MCFFLGGGGHFYISYYSAENVYSQIQWAFGRDHSSLFTTLKSHFPSPRLNQTEETPPIIGENGLDLILFLKNE